MPSASACPGLLRIVPALDGGICRVKLACGQLSVAQAHSIAAAATACASGVLELTNRSNLQIRGVRQEDRERLVDRLLSAGLGPRDAAADDVRNLLVSPAFGLDEEAMLDVAPLAEQLLDHLQSRPAFRRLSPKFALQLDGGENLAVLDHPHDLWLSAVPMDHGIGFAFGLAGCPTDPPLGVVPADAVLTLVDAVLETFIELAQPPQTRMRHLLAGLPTGQLLERLRARLDSNLAAPVPPPREQNITGMPLGAIAQRQPGLCMIGAAPVLGRMTAEQLRAVADIAEKLGDRTLRLTPWQSLLLPNVLQANAPAVFGQLAELGLHLATDEPLTHLVACTGARGCAKGHADTKTDALTLARRLREARMRPDVHLSGCERSCASPQVAAHTLLALPDGRYQLFHREPGAAGFGELVAPALTLDEAGEWFVDRSEPGTNR
ncbi:precorrin-3B synthase [Stutzerimonas azotifigens]|uniref:Precorrin-3B synthase n=1 Tax=Stutzerimonas azotifigens TaxID=291995 RepID=A0ABR5YWF6_9GAMM|nr:precorrin-3B synthase [Stutzerimonas azotifigens]